MAKARLQRNSKKNHVTFARDGINGFGAKNSRRKIRGSKAKKKKDALTPQDFVKQADLDNVVAFVPEHSFADFALDTRLDENIALCGFATPTPIQDQAIISMMENRDVIGIAQTGTGKTAAFLIPLIQKCIMERGQRVLIMTPTRELALQISQEFELLSAGHDLGHVLCVGGTRLGAQEKAIAMKPRFVIGTPGRLRDLATRDILDLSGINNVIVDEIDRMLDMGFLREVRYLFGRVRSERQTALFSATLKKDLRDIAKTLLINPVTIAITPRLSSLNVEQDVVFVEYDQDKVDLLHDVLIRPGMKRVIVFGKTKYTVQHLGAELKDRGFRADVLQGDLAQGARRRILAKFKAGEIDILVATDIMARGIDVPDVTHVINFDVPDNYEDYVHRIGRTGRSGKSGIALTFWERV